MKTSHKLVLLFVVFAAAIIACKKEQQTAPLQIRLTDNPASYDSVKIHITGMQVKVNDDNAGWITINAKDTTVDLLTLQNNVTTVIAQDNVPAGVLKEVRFILGPDNYIVAGGTRYPLSTPSAEDSGLKIKIDKELGTSLNTFILDFDASLSIKQENGNYKLMPVIKLKA